MKTAAEIILEIKELPLEERQKVVDYLNTNEEEFIETCYSPENMAIIERRDEEARQGINVETFSSMSEARKSLGLTS